MKRLYCRGAYHHEPRDLHFDPGFITLDDPVAEFLLQDAPDNFAVPPLGQPVSHGEVSPHGAPAQVWAYWEGDSWPRWLGECVKTLRRHAPELCILNDASFDALRTEDRDIDLNRLNVFQRSDYIRAYLLAHYGGIWVDVDCVALQPLTILTVHLGQYEFVGYREPPRRQLGGGLLASIAGGEIACCAYAGICRALRSGRDLEWMTLIRQWDAAAREVEAETPWLELPTEWIMPISWSAPQAFFTVRTPEAHAQVFDPDALCYMLAAQSIRRHAGRYAGCDLMDEGTFFRFLLEQAGV